MSEIDVTVATLKATQEAQGEVIEKIETRIDANLTKIYDKLDILSTTFNRRPPWAVAALLALLSSACVGLLVRLVG